jgi:hypothetical protein
MTPRNEQHDESLRRELDAIHETLKHLDEAIRGNGRMGLAMRIDRLEQIYVNNKRIYWLLIGIIANSALQWALLFGG